MWITSLLTICNRLFVNKMSQAMRTYPDIDLLQEVNRLVAMQLACFWLRPKMVNASTISYISECDLMNLLSPLGPTMRRMTTLRLLMMILTKCISKYVMLCKIYSCLYIRNLTINKSMQFYDLSYLYFAQDKTTKHNATQRNATQRNATQRNATQRNATQRNATQRNTIHHNTTQHNTTQHITTNHITSHHNKSHHITCISTRLFI